ncbi:MAG: MG2 domain-containing protein [Candidatus Absconditabacteria bacterium]
MKVNKIFNLIVISLFSFTQLPVVQIFASESMKDPEFLDAVDYMYSNGLTKYSDVNDFQPDVTLNREQAAKFFVEFAKVSKGMKVPSTSSEHCKFSDINEADSTLRANISQACEMGIFKGTGGKFLPKQALTKAQALAVLVRITKGSQDENALPWRKNYFQISKEMGYTRETNVISLDRKVSRYEVGLLLFRAKDEGIYNIPTVNNITSNSEIVDKIDKGLISQKSFNIKFDIPMNVKSVEDNFRVYPDQDVLFNWSDNSNLSVSLVSKDDDYTDPDKIDQIREYEEILVNIGTGAVSSTGANLDEVFVKKFKIDGTPMLTFVSPSGEIDDLGQYITARFSKPMIPLTTLDSQGPCTIEITPNLPGKCVWITTSTFQFRPDQGFPMGGNYQIKIPSGIETIAGDKTINSKEFSITTPKFKVNSITENINKDDKILINFNSEVDLNKFIENFTINGIDKAQLNIDYHTINDEKSNNIVSLMPKNGDWGYGKSYSITINKSMSSSRGNVGLDNDFVRQVSISPLLQSSSVFIYKDTEIKNINLYSNMDFSSNNKIILPNNPMILLDFYEEVNLDKSLFSISSGDFDLEYAMKNDCSLGVCKITQDKKRVILKTNGSYDKSLEVKIFSSKISSSNDITLSFSTKNLNQVLSFNFVDYNTSCIKFKNEVSYSYDDNFSQYFEFGGLGKVNYMSKVYPGDRYSKCKSTDGEFMYQLSTRFNPSTDIPLTIKKELLDSDNYTLDKDYSFNFKTNAALNEDKYVSFIDHNEFNLVPTDISPLGIGVMSMNIEKFKATVCEGDFDVSTIGFMKNSVCKTSEIQVNNLGFNTNYSVIDLNKIYGADFNKSLLSLEISKISSDITKYDQPDKKYFMRTNKSLVSKFSYHDKLLWINDFRTGTNLGDEIESINTYKLQSKYSLLGKYIGKEATLVGPLSFQYKTKGLYEINGNPSNYTIIKLKNGEQLFIDMYYYGGEGDDSKFYLSTDRPIYQPGDTVHIKGVGRIFTPNGFELKTGTVPFTINGPSYSSIKNDNMSLNDNGSFVFDLKLDDNSKLGNYSISAGNSYINFTVQEYEKPDFEVKSTVPQKDYLYGENSKVDLVANYYVGAPLTNGQGNYSILGTPYYFDGGKTSGYHWGEERSYWDWGYWYEPSSVNVANNIKFELSSDGKTTLNIPLKSIGDNEPKDMIYAVSVNVKDNNTSKSVTSNASFNVLRSKYFVGLKMNKYYYDFGDEATLDFVTVDTEGNKIGNQNIDLEIFSLEYKKNPDNGQFEDMSTSLLSKTLKTLDNGTVSEKYKFEDSGRYKIVVKKGNYITSRTIYVSGGRLFRPQDKLHDLNISFDKEVYNLNDTANIAFQTEYSSGFALISLEKYNGILGYDVVEIKNNTTVYPLKLKKEYLPGFNVSIYSVQNIGGSKASFDELQETRLEMRSIEQQLFSGNTYYSFPIRPMIYDTKGIYLIMPNYDSSNYNKELLIKLADLRTKENKLLQEILPSYQYGNEQLKMSTDSVTLTTTVDTDKTVYLPGDKAQIQLRFVDSNGNPVNGEAMISVVDEALLALKKDNKESLLDFFYGQIHHSISTKFNLDNLLKRIDFESIVEPTVDGDNDRAYNKSVLGGIATNSMEMKEESLAMDFADDAGIAPQAANGGGGGNESILRTEFKDVAYYQGIVDVKDGIATINISSLPHDLTTWSINGYVITKDTKLGTIESSMLVQKPLSIIPSIPRFFVSGDKTQITAVVVNNTNNPIESKVVLNASNTKILLSEKTINVPANSQKSVEFDIQIDPMSDSIDWNNYSSIIKLELNGSQYSDSLQVSKKIIPYSTPEYTFTNGSTTDLSYEEKLILPDYIDKNQGKLDVQLGSNVLTNVLDGIDSIANVPYWSSSSIFDSLMKIATLKGFYKSVGEIEKFNAIKVKDYNDKEWQLEELSQYLISQLPNYQWTDGGFMYWDDCETSYWRETCSSFDLTNQYLTMTKILSKNGYSLDSKMTNNALNYFKIELGKLVESAKANGYDYNNISPFYTLSKFNETTTITKYLLPDYPNASNYEKLQLISIYDKISPNGDKSSKLYNSLQNAILIEARGSLLPGSSNYWGYSSNVTTTALAMSTFLEKGNGEKLIIENFARWLVAQKNEDGTFGGWGDSALVLDALTDYVNFTGELKDVNFQAKMYLNSKQVLTGTFDSNNKFSQIIGAFPLSSLLFGTDNPNSIGFEKEGTGKLYYDIGFKYFLPVDKIQARDEGIIVNRTYYDFNEYYEAYTSQCDDNGVVPYDQNYSKSSRMMVDYDYEMGYYPSNSIQPTCIKTKTKNLIEKTSGKQGDLMVGVIQVIVPHERNNIIVENFIPSGSELVNTSLDNVSDQIRKISGGDSGRWWYSGFDHVENKTDKLLLSASRLYAGTYTYTYVIKLNHSGEYHNRPAVAYEELKPEIWGRSKGEYFNITK